MAYAPDLRNQPDILFQVQRPIDPTIPTGASITIDPTLNTEPNVVDSGWIDVSKYGGGSLINIISDVSLQAYVLNASDTIGSNIQGNTAPTLLSQTGVAATLGAAFFDTYFRVVIVNVSGGTCNEYSINTTGNQVPVPPVFNSLDQPVFSFFPAPLTRSVTSGINPNGIFANQPAPGIDDSNSTSVNLGISGVFTGEWKDVTLYSEIRVSYDADVNGVNCLLQFSPDAATVERSISVPPQANTLQTNFGAVHTLNPILPYFRIVYTNGPVAQTAFNITTILSTTSGGGLISRATQIVNKFNDVSLQRIINSPEQDRNFGLTGYQSAKRVIGVHPSVPNTAFETIWIGADIGGAPDAQYNFIQAAETVRVAAGGNAADDIAGAGARIITIKGLDENWIYTEEDISLAGASASAATTTTFIRINEILVKTVGTYIDANAGNIILEGVSSGNNLAYIGAEIGRSQQAVYSVPANKTVWVNKIELSVGQNDSATVRMFQNKNADDITVPFDSVKTIEWEITDYSGATEFELSTFLMFQEMSDIYFDAERETGSGSARVSVVFEFIETDN